MDEIMPIVDLILQSQGEVKQWTNVNHVSLLSRIALKAISACDSTEPDAQRIFLCKTLNQHGIAGNASQFRQYLQSTKGGNRIAKGSTNEQTYV